LGRGRWRRSRQRSRGEASRQREEQGALLLGRNQARRRLGGAEAGLSGEEVGAGGLQRGEGGVGYFSLVGTAAVFAFESTATIFDL
jgi:hypothetical protein